MEWIRDNWDKVLNVFVLIFGAGGIATFFTDFMTMCRDRPWQAIFLAALCLSIGYALGLCNRPSAKAARERRREEMRDRKRRRSLFVMRLTGLSPKELSIVLSIVDSGGEAYLKVDDPSVDKLAKVGAIRIHDGVYQPPDKWPFTLDDSLRALMAEFPDALNEAIEKAEGLTTVVRGK